jgi:VIT1/CCC1 family predicted Fe2+/Mn2+ transporter/membrane-associated phospholipid phosphatase
MSTSEPTGRPARWPQPVLAVGAAGAAALGILLLVIVVGGEGRPTALDSAVFELTERWTARVPGAVDTAALVGIATDTLVSFAMAVVVVATLALRRRWVLALFVSVSGLVGVALVELVKWWVDRPRPPGAEAYVDASSGSSFPSGHASVGVYIYVALAVLVVLAGRRHRRSGVVLLGLLLGVLGVLIGVSRVVLGVHWATDVIAGWSLGSAVLLAVAALLRPDDVRRRADPVPDAPAAHPGEAHQDDLASRLNWLRAGVLGANDGIVSTAGLVVGVAGAQADRAALLVAGLAGLVAGALSMAGGEYVSVSTQADTEQAAIDLERWELETMPEQELEELTLIYQAKGLDRELAAAVAAQLSERDALAAHAEAELGVDPEERTNPWHAAWSSMAAFAVGALLPLLAITLPPTAWRVPVTVAAVTAALALTGVVSARLGRAPVPRAVGRNVGIGLLAMTVTFAVGSLVGVAI